MKEERSHDATPVVQLKKPVRCAVYIRALFGASRAAESVRIQREAALAFLKKRAADGWVCSGIYEDIGYSGGTLDRPKLQRLLTAINAGSVDCIIVHTLDRLARMDDALGKTVVLPRLYDVKVIALSPKPFVAISTNRRVDNELASRGKPLHDVAQWDQRAVARWAVGPRRSVRISLHFGKTINRFKKPGRWDSYAPASPPYQPRLLFGTPAGSPGRMRSEPRLL